MKNSDRRMRNGIQSVIVWLDKIVKLKLKIRLIYSDSVKLSIVNTIVSLLLYDCKRVVFFGFCEFWLVFFEFLHFA